MTDDEGTGMDTDISRMPSDTPMGSLSLTVTLRDSSGQTFVSIPRNANFALILQTDREGVRW